ncbi:hypothetical protein [Streptomyces sp. NPDC056244]|uniref:hypothetical protein n=1 Tax=unclassified Streptomyces TaxID=2593676 RepID=UPI0035D84564
MKPIRIVAAGFVAALALGAVSVGGPSSAWAVAPAEAAAGCPAAIAEADAFLRLGTRDPVILANYIEVRIRDGNYLGAELRRAQYILGELNKWCI